MPRLIVRIVNTRLGHSYFETLLSRGYDLYMSGILKAFKLDA